MAEMFPPRFKLGDADEQNETVRVQSWYTVLSCSDCGTVEGRVDTAYYDYLQWHSLALLVLLYHRQKAY
jgi:hypothetical protein